MEQQRYLIIYSALVFFLVKLKSPEYNGESIQKNLRRNLDI